MASKKNKRKKNNSLPTTVEIFQGVRSDIALSAIHRSGGGVHADKRDRKEHKKEWRNEEW